MNLFRGREGASQYQDKQVSTRELLNNGTNTLIEEINAKRKRDQELLSGENCYASQ